MDPQLQRYVLIAAGIALVLIIVLAVVAARRRRERRELRARFGDEYDRTVEARGSKRRAVRDLRERQQLRGDLELHQLNDADRDLVRRHMAALQYRFVEDPADVMLATGRVVTEVLRAMGYPVAADREKALRLYSVDHAAHAGAVRAALEGEHHGSVARMRDVFLGVRRALEGSADVTYGLADASPDAPRELRVENATADTIAIGQHGEVHRP